MPDPNLLTLLISALCIVESGNDPNAVGDSGKAVGILQQHKIFVDEVNRIILIRDNVRNCFSYDDRLDPRRAKLMAQYWFCHHLHEGKSLEECVRRYNAGKHWRGKQAESYYLKVKAILDRT